MLNVVSSVNLFQLSCTNSGYLHLVEGDQYLVVDKMSVSNTVPLTSGIHCVTVNTTDMEMSD
jgi:hypothetical protein